MKHWYLSTTYLFYPEDKGSKVIQNVVPVCQRHHVTFQMLESLSSLS